jgi:hypothetical protein
VPTKSPKRKPGGRHQFGLFQYRIAYEDAAGESQLLLLQSDDRLEPGSIVEDKGRLIQINNGGPTPFRGVLTPLTGRLL